MEGISPKVDLKFRAFEERIAKRFEDKGWPIAEKYEKAVEESLADGWRDINKDAAGGGALECLRFLAGKAKLSPKQLLRDIIVRLWPYSTPPARSRATDIHRIKGFAKRLRDTAKELRDSPIVGLEADIYLHYYHPRRAPASIIAIQRPNRFTLSPDVVHLPDLLAAYASYLENKVGRMKYYAKQEPTEKQYRKDCVDEIVKLVKQVTEKAYREKVAAILRVLQSPNRVEPETIRKRALRRSKSRPA